MERLVIFFRDQQLGVEQHKALGRSAIQSHSGTTAASNITRSGDYYPNKRYGHRVTICGDKPY